MSAIEADEHNQIDLTLTNRGEEAGTVTFVGNRYIETPPSVEIGALSSQVVRLALHRDGLPAGRYAVTLKYTADGQDNEVKVHFSVRGEDGIIPLLPGTRNARLYQLPNFVALNAQVRTAALPESVRPLEFIERGNRIVFKGLAPGAYLIEAIVYRNEDEKILAMGKTDIFLVTATGNITGAHVDMTDESHPIMYRSNATNIVGEMEINAEMW